MKNKVIILSLIFLGLMFCINLNNSISSKVINKNDHIETIAKDNNCQIIGILAPTHENITKVDIYITSAISFNVEPVNGINKAITVDMINSKIVIPQLFKYMDPLYINESLSKKITTALSSKFLQKTFVSVGINNKRWRGFNIYLSQISNKLGKT